MGRECRPGELCGVQDREPGSSRGQQTTPTPGVGSRGSGSVSLTTNVRMRIQTGNKYENEIVNTGVETEGCPLIVTFVFLLTNTTPVWSGTINSPTSKLYIFSPCAGCRVTHFPQMRWENIQSPPPAGSHVTEFPPDRNRDCLGHP